MAFSDLLYLVFFMFTLITVVLVGDYIYNAVFPLVSPQIQTNISTSLSDTWTTTTGFYNGSFIAIFLILGIVSLILAAKLASSPVYLLMFLLFNLVILWFYDGLSTYLTLFLASPLNTGSMNTAASFLQNGLPKALIVINIIVAIVLFGKGNQSQLVGTT